MFIVSEAESSSGSLEYPGHSRRVSESGLLALPFQAGLTSRRAAYLLELSIFSEIPLVFLLTPFEIGGDAAVHDSAAFLEMVLVGVPGHVRTSWKKESAANAYSLILDEKHLAAKRPARVVRSVVPGRKPANESGESAADLMGSPLQ